MIKPQLSMLVLLAVLAGCGQREKQEQSVFPRHRGPFVAYPNDHNFALDTATGTLCKTWQWEHTPKEPIDAIPVCFEMQ